MYMEILSTIVIVLFYCLFPAFVLWLCRKVTVFNKLGPILTLYIIGAIIANIGILPHNETLASVQNILSNAMVPLAIPLMLFSFTFHKGDTKDQLIAMVTGLFAVIIAVAAGYPIFGKYINDGPKVAGMFTACLTGGTVNMASVSQMLGVDGQTYALLNTYDMIVSFVYLIFIMSFGIKLARKFLPVKTLDPKTFDKKMVDKLLKEEENPYRGLWTRRGIIDAGVLLGSTVVVIGLSALFGMLMSKLLEGTFMMFFILAITTISIGASFIKSIHNRHYGNEIGMYFIYIFSLVVASMADVRTLDFTGVFYIIGLLAFMEIVSLSLQLLSAKLFNVDADTAVIASVTYINSPPFVPMIATSMKNSRVIMPGLSIGIVGYAVGNYLGVLIAQLLS